MKAIGKFLLLDSNELEPWLKDQTIKRKIQLIQQHHTYVPSYRHFNGKNHFELCQSMEKAHKERGFSEIAQHFTTFPDGKIMVCRALEMIPAGIKGANSNGICIENIGNFDQDIMEPEHRNSIVTLTDCLLRRFQLPPSENTIVYHHWYDLTSGKRIAREGSGATKTCPGHHFMGGNTVESFKKGFLPFLQ